MDDTELLLNVSLSQVRYGRTRFWAFLRNASKGPGLLLVPPLWHPC